MVIRRVCLCAVLLAFGLLLPLQAQRVIVVPGAAGTGSQASALVPEPFAVANTINAAPGAFLAFADPSGQRFYVVTTGGVVVVDGAGAQMQDLLPISQPVTSAALSPDGRTLVVTAGGASSGTAYLFNTSATPVGQVAAITVGNNPFGVAIGPDSKQAFVLASTGLAPIDLASGALGATLALDGLAVQGTATPGLTLGPNGLLYVNAQAALVEINPANLSVVARMVVTGYPGKPAFRPDGAVVAVPNQLSGNPIATTFNLASHVLAGQLSPLGGSWQFDRLFFPSAEKVYALGVNKFLYGFDPASPSLAAPDFGTGGAIGGLLGGALSNEQAPKYLFLAKNASVLRADLTALTATSATTTTPGGPVFYTAPAVTDNAAAAVRGFNTTQAIAPGAPTLPMIMQVFDSDGLPLAGKAVTWAAGGLTLQSSMTTTNSLGQAMATALAPAGTGAYTVTAAVLGTALNTAFNLQVGAVQPPPGGGGGTGPGLSILVGEGQAHGSTDRTIEPLVVLLLDNTAKAAAGVNVTFTVGGAGGVLLPNTVDAGQNTCTFNGGIATCKTDSKGHASVFFQTPWLQDFQGSWLISIVTAAAAATSTTPAGTVTFHEVTYPYSISGGQLGPAPYVTQLAPVDSQGYPVFTVSGQQGQTIKNAFKVMVNAQSGPQSAMPVPDIGLSVRDTKLYTMDPKPPAYCSVGTALSDAAGIASCDLVIPGTTAKGSYIIYRVTGAYDSAPFTLTVTAAPPPTPVPTTITITGGNNQTGIVGQRLPTNLTAVVKDQNGAVMVNQAVTWTVVTGQATVTGASKTVAGGVASASVTLGATPGPVQVKLAAGNASATFSLTALPQITAVTVVSGNNQTAMTGDDFAVPLTVQVNDSGGHPVGGVPVTFAVANGPAALIGNATVNTNTTGATLGQASISVHAGATAGAVTVTATVAGVNPASFSLTVRWPGPDLSQLTVVNGASFQPDIGKGSLATIFAPGLTAGLEIEPGTCLSGVGIGPVATQVAGVEILFGDQHAPILAICKNLDGTEQANVQVPFELGVPVHDLWLTLRYNADTANPTTYSKPGISVLATAPGIFERVVDSQKIAVAQRPDGSFVAPDNPAHPGEVIRVYAVGLGWTTPGTRTNVPGVPGQVTYDQPLATLNGQGVGGVTATYAENLIGIYIVEFQIPSVPAGSVPLVVGVLEDGNPRNSQESHIPISQ